MWSQIGEDGVCTGRRLMTRLVEFTSQHKMTPERSTLIHAVAFEFETDLVTARPDAEDHPADPPASSHRQHQSDVVAAVIDAVVAAPPGVARLGHCERGESLISIPSSCASVYC